MSLSSPKRIIFLGTPQIAAEALRLIVEKTSMQHQVVAIVSQPPSKAGRGHKEILSPVHSYASSLGIPVLTPESAKDLAFLQEVEALAPDLCITAAYGQVLSDDFLKIPKFGTLNIHPSLLPLYRGAAPVQRAIEAGVDETGVTILFTVRAMDAGPIVMQKSIPLSEHIKSQELLTELFHLGATTLVDLLPELFSGTLQSKEQDPLLATKARKITAEESLLDFQKSATELHNKVRAFSGWPGTKARFLIAEKEEEIKIVTTRVALGSSSLSADLELHGDALRIVCRDGTLLEILELQPIGKRVMSARDYWNGLKIKKMTLR
jgi:methionyl-tRNA formyltransferase